MPDYLITYDFKETDPKPHKPFLTAAEKEGLLYVWKGQTYVNRLPNTTVWGEFATREAAQDAFDRALKSAGTKIGSAIKLEKRCITQLVEPYVLSDRRKEPERRWTGKTSFETSRLHQVNDPYFK